MTTRERHLLIIDPQNDFCDLPEVHRPLLPSGQRATPALPVPGAHADLLRVAGLIRSAGAALTAITVTLDSHQHLDIAHPTFWQTGAGEPVAPFTQISAEDVLTGRFVPRLEGGRERALAYLQKLERQGRYRHMVWPVHCEIGSWGHNVHDELRAAYNQWERQTLRTVAKVTKGENPWTEHYSAIRAEVPVAGDPATERNEYLVSSLKQASRVYITGEAGSHCVKATTEHLVEQLSPTERRKLVLVVDCMSPVTGFESAQREFLANMRALGVEAATSDEVLRELRVGAVEGEP